MGIEREKTSVPTLNPVHLKILQREMGDKWKIE